MCDFMIAASLINGGMQAYGSYMQSQAVKTQMEASAKVAKNNATVAEWQAKDALERGQDAEARHRLQVRGLGGRQRAAMAARGLSLDSGSALDILADTAQLGEADALTLRSNAEREAWGYRTAAGNSRADAAIYRSRAAAENPLFSGATSLLSGASSVAARWYRT